MVATSTLVYPTSCKLDGVVCNLTYRLTSGGFEDIFQGKYQGHTVCVKRVYLYICGDNTSNLRAQAKEFALWAHLSHPNILPFLGAYTPPTLRSPDMICIVSQYIPNGDLLTYLREVPDCPKLLLLFDVVSGLKYLHENLIIHAELKAANVVVSETGHAMICDFGIFRIRSGFTTETPESVEIKSWPSPELLLSNRPTEPTEKSDIWAFGCLCYEVMMGESPFSRYPSYVQMFFIFLERQWNPFDASDQNIDQIDLWLRLLMKKCWDYEPSRRPTSKDIYEQFEKMDIQDNRSPLTNDDPALKEAKRVKAGVEINHEKVYSILQKAIPDIGGLRLSESSPSAPPTTNNTIPLSPITVTHKLVPNQPPFVSSPSPPLTPSPPASSNQYSPPSTSTGDNCSNLNQDSPTRIDFTSQTSAADPATGSTPSTLRPDRYYFQAQLEARLDPISREAHKLLWSNYSGHSENEQSQTPGTMVLNNSTQNSFIVDSPTAWVPEIRSPTSAARTITPPADP
ncbi:hypothetical protein AN958_01397 [Leucoagaricus sp. SymC.cos]|nr:hypothetical protein AN958_01397 [Leucoagaricus sp. SymC.cos]